MIHLVEYKGGPGAPLSYRRIKNGNKVTAYFINLQGKIVDLFNHNIDKYGKVTPEVTYIINGKKYHDFIQLDGW